MISGVNVTPRVLENALVDVLGNISKSEYDYYDEYTGLNGFYHLLAGTGPDVTNKTADNASVSGNYRQGVRVDGVGFFEKIESGEENFDTHEKTWDNFLVFRFTPHNADAQYFRITGSLDSWDGGAWDGRLTEVQSAQKTITYWKEKK